MDRFEVESHICAPPCSLDVDTWEIENKLKETRARFGEAMDKAMGDVEEAEIVTDGISFDGGAKAELLAIMRANDGLEFDGGGGVSCASGFAGSVGNRNITNCSVNSKRMAVAKEANKQLQDKNSELVKERVEQEKKMKIMQERLRDMEANLTNQPSAGLQGTPHLRGNSAPGETPPHQREDEVHCGAGEG